MNGPMDIFMKAHELGVETGFVDAAGRWRNVNPAALAAVIDALKGEGAFDATAEAAPLLRPAFDNNFGQVWVLAVQLYALRSARNWGIGDFSDLRRLIGWAAEAGAAGVGLSPLHALLDESIDCSPYAPNSRLFLNPLYIDVAALPDLPRDYLARHAAVIARLRAGDVVDYATVAASKRHALAAAYAGFKTAATVERRAAFASFRQEGGAALMRFAAFEVLRRELTGPWWEWPMEWRAPDDALIAAMRAGAHGAAMEVVEFVQWCADTQLSACSDLAVKLGLPIGLYLDLAVGVRPDGFDAWHEQGAIARSLAVGAPPDLLNTAGQNWGLAGFNAAGLARRGYAPLRDMLRAAMRYAGAVRLDHAMGLKRLYLIPHGFAADEGVYVRMPFETLLAVVAGESRAWRSIVIGEDLGTVPDGFRERLAAWGIWRTRVMVFERGDNGAFCGVESYPPDTLVTFGTHDLATFAGWSRGHDIALKQALGLDPGESIAARQAAIGHFKTALAGHAIVGDDVFAAIDFLARTPSRILAVMVEDLLGLPDQPNIPGTTDGHPNWRRRLPVAIEDFATAIDTTRLRQALGARSIAPGVGA